MVSLNPPIFINFFIDFNNVVDFIDNSCPRDKVSFNRSKCTPNELSQYFFLTYDLFTDIHVTPGIKCNNPNCKIYSHKSDIIFLYTQPVLCGVLKELCAIRDNTSLCDIADQNDIVVLINDLCIN